MLFGTKYRVGDAVVFEKPKYSTHPGPRAKGIEPEPLGENYSYEVEKYWVIDEVLGEGKVVARTRRGKRHTLEIDDPRLRKARWWERLIKAGRFPERE